MYPIALVCGHPWEPLGWNVLSLREVRPVEVSPPSTLLSQSRAQQKTWPLWWDQFGQRGDLLWPETCPTLAGGVAEQGFEGQTEMNVPRDSEGTWEVPLHSWSVRQKSLTLSRVAVLCWD